MQGGGDIGATPDRLPQFQQWKTVIPREKFEKAWGAKNPLEVRFWYVSDMIRAMERGGTHRTLRAGRKNPADSEADHVTSRSS